MSSFIRVDQMNQLWLVSYQIAYCHQCILKIGIENEIAYMMICKGLLVVIDPCNRCICLGVQTSADYINRLWIAAIENGKDESRFSLSITIIDASTSFQETIDELNG